MKKRWDVKMVQEFTDNTGATRSKWTTIGVAFENRDESIGVQLDAFPKDGKVILQIPMSKEEKEAKWGARPAGGSPRRPQSQPQQGGFGKWGQHGSGRAPAKPAPHPNDGADEGFVDDEGPIDTDPIPF